MYMNLPQITQPKVEATQIAQFIPYLFVFSSISLQHTKVMINESVKCFFIDPNLNLSMCQLQFYPLVLAFYIDFNQATNILEKKEAATIQKQVTTGKSETRQSQCG